MNKITLSACVLTFLTIVLFNSCSRTSFDFAKRKYRSGYYVNLSSGAAQSQVKKAKPSQGVLSDPTKSNTAQIRNEITSVMTCHDTTRNEIIRVMTCLDTTWNHKTQKIENKQKTSMNRIRRIPGKEKGIAHASIPAPEKVILKKEQHVADHNRKGNTEDSDNRRFLLFSSLAAIISSGVLLASKKYVKKISRWANENKLKSRAISVGTQTALGVSSFVAGSMLSDHGFNISDTTRNILTTGFLASALVYPYRNSAQKILKYPYTRQKLSDLSLACTGFLLMIAAGNQVTHEVNHNTAQSVYSTSVIDQYAYNSSEAIKDVIPVHLRDEPTGAPVYSGGEKAGLMFLAFLLFTILLIVLAGVSCSISCNGNDGLAALVFFGGLALLIYLLTISIQGIYEEK